MIKESYYLDYLNSLIEGDKTNCLRVLKQIESENSDIIDVYMNLFQRSLYQIGKMWDKEKLNVADEHNATKITDTLLTGYFSRLSPAKKIGKTAVITCINKEFHELGAKMAAHIFEVNGWDTHFLGASTPPKDVLKFIKAKQPDVVGLSFNFYLNFLKLVEVIDHIRRLFPEQEIIVGGQGLKSFSKKLSDDYPDIKTFESVKELDDYLKSR
jgi:MerR family transcriptional regulator, light-induced transcriptional regulator